MDGVHLIDFYILWVYDCIEFQRKMLEQVSYIAPHTAPYIFLKNNQKSNETTRGFGYSSLNMMYHIN